MLAEGLLAAFALAVVGSAAGYFEYLSFEHQRLWRAEAETVQRLLMLMCDGVISHIMRAK